MSEKGAVTRASEASGLEDSNEIVRHMRLLYHSRECALVAAFVERYGDEAWALAAKANYEAGFAAGKAALSRSKSLGSDLKSAAVLYAQTYRGAPPTEVSELRLVYVGDKPCQYWPVWRAAGLSLTEGCNYNGAWTEGFFHAINPRIKKTREAWRPGGDNTCIEVFALDTLG